MSAYLYLLLLAFDTHAVPIEDLSRLAVELDAAGRKTGLDPVMLAAVALEEGRFVEAPPRHGTGCGVMQVLPDRWGRPSCAALENYSVGVAQGARILSRTLARCQARAKAPKTGSGASTGQPDGSTWRCALTAYNGAASAGYARRVMGTYRAMLRGEKAAREVRT